MATGFPLNPTNNQTYTNVGGISYIYSSVKKTWRINVTSSGSTGTGNSNVYIGTTPPAASLNYSFWYNNSDGSLYFYSISDVSWVQIDMTVPVLSSNTFASFASSLPTAKPSQAGQPWLAGNFIAIS